MSNTTKLLQEEFNERIKRPQIRETKSGKLEDEAKQERFRDLCKSHSIVTETI